MPSVEDLNIGPFSTRLQQPCFLVNPNGLEATAPVFGEQPSGQAPWSSDGNSETIFKQLPIQIDSASQDFSMCLSSLYRSDEVFPEYDKL